MTADTIADMMIDGTLCMDCGVLIDDDEARDVPRACPNCCNGQPLIPAPRNTAVDSDGWLYDVDSGEVLGLAEVADAFLVNNHDAADFVLKIRSEIEGDIVGIDARLKALSEQLNARRAIAVRRLAWWEWRFGSQLVDFAKTLLRGKSRTAQFNWGRVAFRRTAGTNTITDMAAAVDFVATYAPEKIKVVRSVTIHAVNEAAILAEEASGEGGRLAFVATTEGEDRATITTGIELEKGKK